MAALTHLCRIMESVAWALGADVPPRPALDYGFASDIMRLRRQRRPKGDRDAQFYRELTDALHHQTRRGQG